MIDGSRPGMRAANDGARHRKRGNQAGSHKPAGAPSCSDLPVTGVQGRVLAQIVDAREDRRKSVDKSVGSRFLGKSGEGPTRWPILTAPAICGFAA